MTEENRAARLTILKIISEGGASHVASAFSVVEILSGVFKSVDIDKIKKRDVGRDRIILSKGHSAAALYTIMTQHGLMSEEVLATYCKNDSLLQGHSSHFVPYTEHSTGALGHGASVGLGASLGLQARKSTSRVFVITGDAELQEGSSWEAFMLAGQRKLNNFCVLVDSNGISQMGKLDMFCTIEPLPEKFKSFNFEVKEVDGNDEHAVMEAIGELGKVDKPVAIICRTTKGKGVSFMENSTVWHYRPPAGTDYEKAVAELKSLHVQ